MRTVAKLVDDVLRERPFLEEALEAGVVNHSALARKIKAGVDKRAYRGVTAAAIGMALRRRAGKAVRRSGPAPRISHLTVQSRLVDIVFRNSPASSKALHRFLSGIREEGRWFCHAVHGLSETAVVVSAELEPRLVRAMEGERVVLRHGDLAALTLRLRGGSADRPGLYFPILRRLAGAGVPFVEIASVNDELVVLLRDPFVARACEAVGTFVEAAK